MTSAPDRRGAIALTGALVLLVALTVWRLQADPADVIHDFAGLTMGTTYQVRIDADLTAAQRGDVADLVQSRLDEIDRLMSTYDSTSELSRFNRHSSEEPYSVSSALLEVMAKAHEVSMRSGGAFDVTVGPLVDAWGFGPSGEPERAPDAALLETLSDRIGYERIVLDPVAGTISKTTPDVVIDLSAIAKGYAADQVATDLKELGLNRILVEIGGELRAGDRKRDGASWRVGIESPDVSARRVYATLDLVDQAVATSGDYRNFYEDGGVRYAHIIDPRSGTPIRSSGASVTVIHADGTMADAWATALSVLGPEAGYDLALREGVAALFVMRSADDFRSRATPAFLERVVQLTEVGSR